MAFFGLLIAFAALLVIFIGIIVVLLGITFLIIFFVKRKHKRLTVFLILGIIFISFGLALIFIIPQTINTVDNIQTNFDVSPDIYPINNAIYLEDNKKLEKLLEEGNDPNEIYMDEPAIYHACFAGANTNVEAVELLLQYGADPNLRGYGEESLMECFFVYDYGWDTGGKEDSGVFEAIKVLVENGYDVNEVDEENISILMYAMNLEYYLGYSDNENSAFDIVRFLIDEGADVNHIDNEGRTVLMWACGTTGEWDDIMYDEPPSNKPLIENKYDFSFDYDIIKLLIDSGADNTIKDNNGFTAFDYFNEQQRYSKMYLEYDRELEEYIYMGRIFDIEEYKDDCEKIEEILK